MALSVIGPIYTVNAQTGQTQSKIEAANSAVQQAFNAILNAEKAGANVTSLTNQLNDVADLLAEAENAYRTGDTSVAESNADAALPIAQQVTAEAQTAQENAISVAQASLQNTLVITVVAAAVFVVVLLLVWRQFKRRYVKSLLEAKPEVTGP